MDTTRTVYARILRWPDGTPMVGGRQLTVKHIAAPHRFNGMAPAELCETFPPLTLGEMYGALAYYCGYKDESARKIDEVDLEFEEGRAGMITERGESHPLPRAVA